MVLPGMPWRVVSMVASGAHFIRSTSLSSSRWETDKTSVTVVAPLLEAASPMRQYEARRLAVAASAHIGHISPLRHRHMPETPAFFLPPSSRR